MNIVVDNAKSVLKDFCNTESKNSFLRIVEKDVLTEDVIISDDNIRNSANFCVGIWD